MVTALKLSKDINKTYIEELVSYLISHEIELEEDEPKRKTKSISLKSSGRSKKTKALQVETDEESEEESEEKDELSLLFRRVNQLWKKTKGKFKGQRRTSGRSESTYGSKKVGAGKEFTCFKCNKPGHFKNECPKLNKKRPIKNLRGNKKGLMDTWDDSKSSEDDSEEEQANVALMACTKAPAETIQSEPELDYEEVFPKLSRSELEFSLSEVLEIYQNILNKYKDLKKFHGSESKAYCKLQKEFSSLSEEKLTLKNNNFMPLSKSLKPKKKSRSKSSTGSGDIIKKYDKSFQKFLAKILNICLMLSMIYGVTGTGQRVLAMILMTNLILKKMTS